MKAGAVIKKVLIYTGIAALLLFAGLLVYAGKAEMQDIEYSTYSTNKTGVKALYLLAHEMGFSVERYKRSSRFLPEEAILVAIEPESQYVDSEIEKKYLKKWIESGNTLVLISGKDYGFWLQEFTDGDIEYYADDNGELGYKHFQVGKGKLSILDNSEMYTNEGLKGYKAGVLFIEILSREGNKPVLFNEYYHGIAEEGLDFFDLIGPTGLLVFIQILLGLIVLMYTRSRRFGKVEPVVEIIKRKENENLLALSSILMKSKANSLVIEAYLKNFRIELSRYLGFTSVADDAELARAAAVNKILKNVHLGQLLYTCEEYIQKGEKDTKKLIYLVKNIEEIRKGIK